MKIKISDLPDGIKELAKNNQAISPPNWHKGDQANLSSAFSFSDSPEGWDFWTAVNEGDYEKAVKIKVSTMETSRVFDTGSKRDSDSDKPEKIFRRFPSGAVRSDDRGRVRPDYISPYALEEIAKHFTSNEKEFGSEQDATNYFLGIRPVDVKASISRHYIELMQSFHPYNGDEVRLNLRAMAANCIMALHQIAIEEKGLYKEPYEKTEYIKKS